MSDFYSNAEVAAFVGHRRGEHWEYEALSYVNEAPLGRLLTVTGASFDCSIFNTIRTGGTLEVDDPETVDWKRIKVQPWYVFTSEAGDEYRWPMGIFIPSSPTTAHSDTGTSATVELYDKMLELDRFKVDSTYTIDTGDNIVDDLVALIQTTGETKIAIETSDETAATPMVWEAGTTVLKIVNEALAAINYFSIWADGMGFFRGTPYTAPAARGLFWRFANNFQGVYEHDFSHDEDGFDVPNKVVAIGQSEGEGEVPAPIGTAVNNNPDSPWSYQARNNRWIVHVETGVDASTEEMLGQIAARRLIDLSQTTSTYEIKHAVIPIPLNSAVTFRHTARGVDVLAVLQKYSVSSEVGSPITATLREVAP